MEATPDVYLAVARDALARRGYPRQSIEDLAATVAARPSFRALVDAAQAPLHAALTVARAATVAANTLAQGSENAAKHARVENRRLHAEIARLKAAGNG